MKSSLVKLAVILIGVVMLCYGVASGQEKYLCVTEHATGFSYNENTKEWKSATFKADSKYIITKSDEKEYSFKVTKVGEDSPFYQCEKGINKFGYLFCKGIVGEFKFNRLNGRFLATHPYGYFDVIPKHMRSFEDKAKLIPFTDKDSDTPSMEIGKCSPF